jgi:hypothetical protein
LRGARFVDDANCSHSAFAPIAAASAAICGIHASLAKDVDDVYRHVDLREVFDAALAQHFAFAWVHRYYAKAVPEQIEANEMTRPQRVCRQADHRDGAGA